MEGPSGFWGTETKRGGLGYQKKQTNKKRERVAGPGASDSDRAVARVPVLVKKVDRYDCDGEPLRDVFRPEVQRAINSRKSPK